MGRPRANTTALRALAPCALAASLIATALGLAQHSIETRAAEATPPGSPHTVIEQSVAQIIARMQTALPPEARVALDPAAVRDFLTQEERDLLSAGFVRFRVTEPVTVYVAFESGPGETPFWLPEREFERRPDLDFLVDGEDNYSTWARDFEAGEIALGVPSFSGEMKPYIVLLSDRSGRPLAVEPLVQGVDVVTAQPGQSLFLDDDDALSTVPEPLRGLPVLRSYESWEFVSRLVGHFRTTDYPSSEDADQVLLTLQGDPASSVSVQWRTAPLPEPGVLWLSPADALTRGAPGRRIQAEAVSLPSPQIVNDPQVQLHRVRLEGLQPDTRYVYAISTDGGTQFGELREFRTAPSDDQAPYAFVYLGDPQNGLDQWGELLRQSAFRFPQARFYAIAGDLIDKGTHRDNWDQFLYEGSPVFAERAMVPAIGNHDSHGGHPTLYLQQFALPGNGTPQLDPGRTYHVRYQDLLLVVLDSNYDLIDPDTQTEWLDRVLGESDARWKTVIYHHPLYASHPSRDNFPLREAWLPIFDRHGVDIAFQGHDHAYMRTVPMRAGRPVAEGEHGTVYLVAVSGTKMYEQALPEFAAFGATDTRTFQLIEVDPAAGTLHYRAIDSEGRTVDAFTLSKPPTP